MVGYVFALTIVVVDVMLLLSLFLLYHISLDSNLPNAVLLLLCN